MRIAVVYNRENASVINLFGLPNREKIGLKTIKQITSALKAGGHRVIAIEGDKDLIDRLEEFMPRVLKGEVPGLVFNLSYGIQGQARYTHVPSILEMVGIPYIASGPLAHSLALDKVVTKMILRQHGLPTPEFAVLQTPDSPVPNLKYPIVLKPKNEAVSFGLSVVYNEEELRAAARVISQEFHQAVLAEQFIEGREINVGLLGNDPPEAFPPVELNFGDHGPSIYTLEDKTGRSGRTITHVCPAPIGEERGQEAQKIAKAAFAALGCYDCARVDMRLGPEGNLTILEVNSLPSLGEHGSYRIGAGHVGLDFSSLINRLVDVASTRYFGTPHPPQLAQAGVDLSAHVFNYLTQRRDRIEHRLKEWTGLASRTNDPAGIQQAAKRLQDLFGELGMRPVAEFSKNRTVWTWETAKGFRNGLLFIGNLDIPIDTDMPRQPYRREPEWLHGEGIGSSRAPLVMLEFVLRALRGARHLRTLPVGVMYYADEGLDARYSEDTIRAATANAKEILILRPGTAGDHMITQRRGQRQYRLRVEGEPLRPGRVGKKPAPLRWCWSRLDQITQLTSQKDRISVSTMNLKTDRLPMRLPHRVTASVLVTYPDAKVGDALVEKIRALLGRGGPQWELQLLADRPPFEAGPGGRRLFKEFVHAAERFEIPLTKESSVWPSVAGLIPAGKPCLCGIGPVASNLHTPQEAVRRISLVQRTILLAEFIVNRLAKR